MESEESRHMIYLQLITLSEYGSSASLTYILRTF
jgi:hypothetical protein